MLTRLKAKISDKKDHPPYAQFSDTAACVCAYSSYLFPGTEINKLIVLTALISDLKRVNR
jgi:hypothetical protein